MDANIQAKNQSIIVVHMASGKINLQISGSAQ